MAIQALTQLPAWQALKRHFQSIRKEHLRTFFADDPRRGERLVLEAVGIYFDYSKHLINDETLRLLLQLAEESQLRAHIDAMFHGDKINVTEQEAAFHVALRAPRDDHLFVDGDDVVPAVHRVLDKMAVFAQQIRSGEWRGYTGKAIRNIITIGIGGSGLGPAMAYDALRYYSHRDLYFGFVSNIDGTAFVEATKTLNPEETLFIISSKSFTTIETIANARSACDWLLNTMKNPDAFARHVVAVSTNSKAVRQFGIKKDNFFEFWNWVDGRFSMDSAVGLSTMIAIGPDHFHDMLKGFHQMDEHFHTASFDRNLPVIMALLTVWYNNFFEAQTVAVLPYELYLKQLPAYIQQLAMESNGKYLTIDGNKVNYQTGPIYWGEPGTNGQHSFCQLLHQGTKLIPCDFIGFINPLNPLGNHHDLLMANLFAQTQALAFGKTAEEVVAEGTHPRLVAECTFEGNRPSSTLLLERLTPVALGQLIALYEHNVFVQGAIWQIDSFDQWGVELGKDLAKTIMQDIEGTFKNNFHHDSSTNALICRYKKNRGDLNEDND